MDTIECIKTRRTCYEFKKMELGKITLTKILDAGTWAPSSGNLQNWRFLVITDPEKRRTVAHATLQPQLVMSAPTVIVVCSLTEKVTREFRDRGKLYATQNTAAAIENMLLAANSMEIGGTWIGAFAEPKLRKILKVPDDVEIHAILLFGYYKALRKPTSRFGVNSVTFFNEWDVKDIQKKFFPLTKSFGRKVDKFKDIIKKIR